MREIFARSSVEDTRALGETSHTMRAAVVNHSVVPHIQGFRDVHPPPASGGSASTSAPAAGPTRFYTTEPASQPKRYFQQMSGAGSTAQTPHVSEQVGHPRHLTDVAGVTYGKNAPGGLGTGPHPSTIQFRETAAAAASSGGGVAYQLGGADIPTDAKSSRVYTPTDPATSGLPPGTHVNPRYLAKANRGDPLGSAPTQVFTPSQAAQTTAQVNARWGGSLVTGRDRPPPPPGGGGKT